MFFLITHATFDKFYPSKFTQFVIGIIFYFVSFMILREIIDGDIYEEYKFHLVSLLIIDASYLVYLHNFSNKNTNDKSDITTVQTHDNSSTISMFLKDNTDVKKNDGSLDDDMYILSEMNDFRVIHDVSDTEHDNVLGCDNMSGNNGMPKNNSRNSLDVKSKNCSSDNNIKLSSLMKSVDVSVDGFSPSKDEFSPSSGYSTNDRNISPSNDRDTCSSNGPTLSDHILPHDDQFLSSENNTITDS